MYYHIGLSDIQSPLSQLFLLYHRAKISCRCALRGATYPRCGQSGVILLLALCTLKVCSIWAGSPYLLLAEAVSESELDSPHIVSSISQCATRLGRITLLPHTVTAPHILPRSLLLNAICRCEVQAFLSPCTSPNFLQSKFSTFFRFLWLRSCQSEIITKVEKLSNDPTLLYLTNPH